VAAATVGALVAGMAVPAAAQDAAKTPAAAPQSPPVTYERLLHALDEPQNWLMVGQNYDVTRNSPLKQINQENVGSMVPLFAVDICGWSCTPNNFKPTDRVANGSHTKEEAVPLVADGFLYIEDGLSKVSKIDVRDGHKGTFIWRFDPEITSYRDRKGVALMNDRVYVCAGTPRGIALDMNSGEVVYDTDLHAPNQPGATILKDGPLGQTMTAPPMVVHTAGGKNVQMCGRAGIHAGNHSFDAVDADSGDFLWRFYSTPGPGQPGHSSWQNDAWQVTSIGFWGYQAWDPKTNVVITGTGDIWPTADPEFRPGDNLFGGSMVALDPDTGKVKWYFQYIPNERYDNDSVSTPQIWTNKDGKRVVSSFNRDGFWYNFDLDASAAGGIPNPQHADYPPIAAFLGAHMYVNEVSWTKGIDPKTGMPLEYDNAKLVQVYNDVPGGGTPRENIGQMNYHCPSWNDQQTGMEPNSLDLERRVAYAVVNEDCTTSYSFTEVKEVQPSDWPNFFTGGPQPCCWTGEDIHRGWDMVSMNLDTGERKVLASWPDEFGNESGVLGTEGGLLMTAWPAGEIEVLDKDSGKKLWSFNVGTSMAAAPMTYAIGDKQYFAILAGGERGSISGIPDPGFALGGTPVLWVFGLPNKS
jgi:alcohol dehydrogenase (cytochrome c)